MKRIVLIKTTNSTGLGHVYEHLYCRALFAYLSNQGLIYYIDYSMEGVTYINGLIDVAIDLFSSKAKGLADKLKNVPMTIDETSLEIALSQVVAEEQRKVWGVKKDKLLLLLSRLHSEPWRTMDDIDIIHLPSKANIGRDFYYIDSRVRPRILNCNLVAESGWSCKYPDLVPLFEIVSHAILENVARELASQFGYYREDNPSSHTKNSACSSQKLTTWTSYRSELTNELEVAKTNVEGLLKQGFISRMSDYLCGLRSDDPIKAPDELRIFESTHTIVGYNGWRKIGTEANIKIVLEHSTLFLKFGSTKQHILLTDILI